MRCLLVALPLAFTACATTAGTASTSDASRPLARYGTHTITVGEADERAKDELFKLRAQEHELRTDAAERIALEAIVREAALKENTTEEKWLEAQVEASVKEPTEEDLHQLYDKVKGRIDPADGFETVRPMLVDAAKNEARRKRVRDLFAELLTKAHYEVLVAEPVAPRKDVPTTGPTKGVATAPVTIVEFADFQCPYCGKAAATAAQVLAAYPGQVKLVFRHFPLSFHERAPLAGQAAACADEQGKFWAYHDALFGSGGALEESDLVAQAEQVGLDRTRFAECLASPRGKAVVARDLEEGKRLGVTGTPAFFINGVMISGAQPEAAFRKIIDRELAKPAK